MIIAAAVSLLYGFLVAFNLVRVLCDAYFVFNEQDDPVGILVCVDPDENINPDLLSLNPKRNLSLNLKCLDYRDILSLECKEVNTTVRCREHVDCGCDLRYFGSAHANM